MKLPTVSANFAVSIDGKIAARGKGPTSFTSARDRRRMLELRAQADAVLVGRGTLEADDMPLRLPARDLQELRIRSGRPAEPLRVVFSGSGRLRKNLRIFRGGAPIVVFTTAAIPASTRHWLEKVSDVRIGPHGRQVDARRALAVLARDYGVRSVLCEGGAEVFRTLVEAGLVGWLHLTFAPVIIGGADAPTLLGPAHKSLLRRSVPLRLESFRQHGDESFVSYRFPAGMRRQ